jgi:hypothetical protein
MFRLEAVGLPQKSRTKHSFGVSSVNWKPMSASALDEARALLQQQQFVVVLKNASQQPHFHSCLNA